MYHLPSYCPFLHYKSTLLLMNLYDPMDFPLFLKFCWITIMPIHLWTICDCFCTTEAELSNSRDCMVIYQKKKKDNTRFRHPWPLRGSLCMVPWLSTPTLANMFRSIYIIYVSFFNLQKMLGSISLLIWLWNLQRIDTWFDTDTTMTDQKSKRKKIWLLIQFYTEI